MPPDEIILEVSADDITKAVALYMRAQGRLKPGRYSFRLDLLVQSRSGTLRAYPIPTIDMIEKKGFEVQ